MNLWHGSVAGVLACWVWSAAPAGARQTADASNGAGLDSSPITCWWRTDRRAVYVGEQFTLALTCGVIETAEVRVLADSGRLDPAALDLTPFEVVGGTRHEDIQAPPWRYFQYSYTLRLLGDEFFGQDVDVPSIPITYSVEASAPQQARGALSSSQGGVTGARGRDQLYLLPPLPVRVLSLVPRTATDIQEVSPDTFGDIDRRMVRATGELAAAGVFFAFAAVLAGVAVVRIARARLAHVGVEPRVLSSAEVLRGCIREVLRLKSETDRSGWTADLIGRSLTVFRIAGTLALGRPVAQRVVDSSVPAREGQLTIRKGPLSTERVLISGATTAAAVTARLAAEKGEKKSLEELSESLRVFAAARYGRSGDLDASALDAALDTGTRALRRLYAMIRWPARTADALSRAAARLRGAV